MNVLEGFCSIFYPQKKRLVVRNTNFAQCEKFNVISDQRLLCLFPSLE